MKLLLSICHQQQVHLLEQAEQLASQAEQIRQLKDEIAVLKGEKGRPKITPSDLTKPPRDPALEGDEKPPRNRGRPVRKKTADLEVHQEQIIQPQ